MKYIYTLTGIYFGFKYQNHKMSRDGKFHSYYKRTSKSQKKIFTIIDSRTWGWFTKLKDAKRGIEKNFGDIFEGMYNMAVIEKVPEGMVVNVPVREWWYVWSGSWENGGYVPAVKPKQYQGVIKFWG